MVMTIGMMVRMLIMMVMMVMVQAWEATLGQEEAGSSSGSRPKVGFGKTLQSAVVWLGGLSEALEQPYLVRKMKMYGEVKDCLIDNTASQALVTFANVEAAVEAVKALKSKSRQIASAYVQVPDFTRIPEAYEAIISSRQSILNARRTSKLMKTLRNFARWTTALHP